MFKRLALACVATTAAGSFVAAQAFHFTLPPTCQLPFSSIAPQTDPYEACDATGNTSGHAAPTKAKTLESGAKNNFCADTSEIVPMHFEDFARLESATDPTTMDLAHTRDDLKVIEDRITDGVMRDGGSELSLLVVKHDRTSSLSTGKVRSIADAYVRWITDADAVGASPSRAGAHNGAPYISGRIRVPTW
jgi:hypothetical protein